VKERLLYVINIFVPFDFSDSVTKEISESDRKKILELEEAAVGNRNEISKLKEISEVATSQVKTLEMVQLSREKENASLRQQLLDFQIQSDEKTIIGKETVNGMWRMDMSPRNRLYPSTVCLLTFTMVESQSVKTLAPHM
jgi:hypothetical protein